MLNQQFMCCCCNPLVSPHGKSRPGTPLQLQPSCLQYNSSSASEQAQESNSVTRNATAAECTEAMKGMPLDTSWRCRGRKGAQHRDELLAGSCPNPLTHCFTNNPISSSKTHCGSSADARRIPALLGCLHSHHVLHHQQLPPLSLPRITIRLRYIMLGQKVKFQNNTLFTSVTSLVSLLTLYQLHFQYLRENKR